ncbi:MAG: DUF2232 domain-containing protein [Deltaproteobacteria bacterium]|jgi:hypothetical protein|nr:DUF2232 domain-containing protein [Deltaproteobacteria bacterium]
MNNSIDIKTIAIAAIIAAAIYVSGLLVIMAPLPLLYIYAAHGRRPGLFTAVLASIMVALSYLIIPTLMGSLSADSTSALPGVAFLGVLGKGDAFLFGCGYFLFYVAIAVALGEGLSRRWPLFRVGGVAVMSALAMLLFLVILMALSGDSLIAGAKEYIVAALNELGQINTSAGAGSVYAELMVENSEEIAIFILKVMPSLVFVYSLIVVTLNFLLGRRILAKRGKKVISTKKLNLKLPDWLVWFVIASGFLFFADKYLFSMGALATLAINSLIALLALYFLQGMAVISHVLQGVRTPIIRTLAYVLIIIFFQTISIAIVAVGLADVWANFRLKKLKPTHNHSS